MVREALCDNCGERSAVTSCNVCGSRVCRQCNMDYGCASCNGGEKTL